MVVGPCRRKNGRDMKIEKASPGTEVMDREEGKGRPKKGG
jgi:hypothetical protein